MGHLARLDGAPAPESPLQQGLYQWIDRLSHPLGGARWLAVAEQHGGAQDGEPLPVLGQQGLLHFPLGAQIEGRGAGVGAEAGDDQQATATVATGEGGEGQHIVVIHPAKRRIGAGVLAGGAKATEGKIDGGG
ncbi:hypothetical protein D3C85_1381340 [compost metagenome]